MLLTLLLAAAVPFTSVVVEGEVHVRLTARGSEARVDAPPGVTTSIKDRVLTIRGPATSREELEVQVVVPGLTVLEARGTARVDAADIDGKSLEVKLGGASRMELRGRITTLRVEQDGSARLDAAKLVTQDARVTLSGAARATVSPSSSLEAVLGGASLLTCTTRPKRVDKTLSGAARLKLRD